MDDSVILTLNLLSLALWWWWLRYDETQYAITEYVISMPNMYARGILWGKMVLELGDNCTARNDRLGLAADIQFKTKGYFSGQYNSISGKIRRTTNSQDLGEISGKWSSVMEYKTAKVRHFLCANTLRSC